MCPQAIAAPNKRRELVTLPPLHPGQREVANNVARFKVLAAGRRWRKTSLGTLMCLERALMGQRTWYVAPTYKMARPAWRELRRLSYQMPKLCRVSLGDQAIYTVTGGEVTVRSADEPDSLRGEGLDFVFIDEAAFIKALAWDECLRPALSDRLGSALIGGTPKGRNWFWKLWLRGQDPLETEWASFRFSTTDNPFMSANEIAEVRRNTPERIFQQEYEAAFLEDAGGIFRKVLSAAILDIDDIERVTGHNYAMGVDWGRDNDFTVISILDTTTREFVYYDRSNKVEYSVQRGRIGALYERFKPDVIIPEANSVGTPIIEELHRNNLPVRAFTTTHASKLQAIDALSLAFELEGIHIPNDPVVIGEFEAYEQTRTPAGVVRYNAPEGMHDDIVMSFAMAWQAIAGPELETNVLEYMRKKMAKQEAINGAI
jgi:hypothetical protein